MNKKTYPDADYEHIRMAFDAAAELWNKTGRAVAKYSGFTYPEKTEKRMLDFINEFIKEQSR